MAALTKEAREVLAGFADEVDRLASQLQGPRARKAGDLAQRIRDFDGTKAAAVELLQETAPTEP